MSVVDNLKKLTWFDSSLASSIPDDDIVDTVVIFLHGSGDTGPGVQEWVEQLHPLPIPRTALLFPTAPPRPYTLYGGALSTVWHDREDLSLAAKEDIAGLDGMCDRLEELVEGVGRGGVKVVLGGFSQGGHLALHAVYRRNVKVVKAFALSSFLSEKSAVYRAVTGKSTPLFMSSGTLDTLVPMAWTEDTVAKLEGAGVDVVYSQVEGAEHQMEEGQLGKLFQWIRTQ